MARRFEGKVVAITGGAMGIGLEVARGFADEGSRVAILDVDKTRAEMAATALNGRAWVVDVSDYGALSRAVDEMVQRFGTLDGWINNAAVFPVSAAETMSVDTWRQAIDVMLSGAFFGCQLAGRVMLKQRHGFIINVASMSAFSATQGNAAYSAAKAGLVQLTRVLGVEWAGRGVRVNAVAPGHIATEKVREAIEKDPTIMEARRLRHPIGRLGQVGEVAEAILFLASEDASYITAECLRVDGGSLAYQYLYPAATWHLL